MFFNDIEANLGQDDVSLIQQVHGARFIKGFATLLAYLLPAIVLAILFGSGACKIGLQGIICQSSTHYFATAIILVFFYSFAVFIYVVAALSEWHAIRRLLPYQRPKNGTMRAAGKNPVTRA